MDKLRVGKQQSKDQVKQFRKAARELGCDESEERFRDALRTIAKQKPKEPTPKATRPGPRRARVPRA